MRGIFISKNADWKRKTTALTQPEVDPTKSAYSLADILFSALRDL